jgi:hypothetical protein
MKLFATLIYIKSAAVLKKWRLQMLRKIQWGRGAWIKLAHDRDVGVMKLSTLLK